MSEKKKKVSKKTSKKKSRVDSKDLLVEPSITYDSRIDTFEHILEVQKYMSQICRELNDKALIHDQSKLQDPEKDLFDKWTPVLRDLTYGSDEYNESLEKLKPALKHHYNFNSHHPEFFEQEEIWKDIIGYEELYQISSFGRIKSLGRIVERSKMGSFDKEDSFRKPHVTAKGYLRVQLAKDGTTKNFFVHRLVAEAFVENRNEDKIVNHLNGIKTDNRIANLEWCTISENNIHAYENGLKTPNVKYIVKCITLDIVTEGCQKMEKELRDRGYEKASAAGIYRCITKDGAKHLDLEFESYKIDEYENSLVEHMNIMELVEMFCDWKAASNRQKDGDIKDSLIINKTRFHLGSQIHQIFENTVKKLGW